MASTHRLSIVLLLASTACAVKSENSPDSTAVGSTSVTTTPAPADIPMTKMWTITGAGLGPLRIDQSIAEANAAVGGGFSGSAASCTYAAWPEAPTGVAVMLAKGRVVRIEVRSGKIATAVGAHIGDSESRISALYPGRVSSSPHKYNPGGHYLTVRAPNASNRMVFETDGGSVTNYRVGRSPEVEQVERCG